MSRLNALSVAIFLTLATALTLAACGGGGSPKLLSGANASRINAKLDEVQQLAAEENCIGAENAAAAVREEIDALEGVDARLKQALVQGAEQLNTVVSDCEEPEIEAEAQAREAEEAERAAEEGEEGEGERKAHKQEKGGHEKGTEEEAPTGGKEGGSQPSGPGKGSEEGGGEEQPAEEGGGESGSGGIGPGAPVGEG